MGALRSAKSIWEVTGSSCGIGCVVGDSVHRGALGPLPAIDDFVLCHSTESASPVPVHA